MERSDSERLSTLEDQGRWNAEQMHEMRQDIKMLLEFRWKLMGMSVVIAFVATLLVEMARAGGKS